MFIKHWTNYRADSLSSSPMTFLPNWKNWSSIFLNQPWPKWSAPMRGRWRVSIYLSFHLDPPLSWWTQHPRAAVPNSSFGEILSLRKFCRSPVPSWVCAIFSWLLREEARNYAISPVTQDLTTFLSHNVKILILYLIDYRVDIYYIYIYIIF